MANSFAHHMLMASLLLLFIPACTPTATCDAFGDYKAQCTDTNGNCAFFIRRYSAKMSCKDWCESQQSTCVSRQENEGGYGASGDKMCTGKGAGSSSDCTRKEWNHICTCKKRSIPPGVTIIYSCDAFNDYNAQCTGTNGNCAFFIKASSSKTSCKDWCESQQSTCVSRQENEGGYGASGDKMCTGKGAGSSSDCTRKEWNHICTCKKKPTRMCCIIYWICYVVFGMLSVCVRTAFAVGLSLLCQMAIVRTRSMTRTTILIDSERMQELRLFGRHTSMLAQKLELCILY